jgi:hypothetical protein
MGIEALPAAEAEKRTGAVLMQLLLLRRLLQV